MQSSYDRELHLLRQYVTVLLCGVECGKIEMAKDAAHSIELVLDGIEFRNHCKVFLLPRTSGGNV